MLMLVCINVPTAATAAIANTNTASTKCAITIITLNISYHTTEMIIALNITAICVCVLPFINALNLPM